jgi:HD-GYP domain-containing protein (c-di-GMP phosphodiesterase class II)
LRVLREGVRAIGAGDLHRRIPAQSTDDLGMLAGEFNRMASHLEERNAQADALYEVAVEISSLHDMDATLHLIAERARQVLHADLVTLDLQDPVSGELCTRAAAGGRAADRVGRRQPAGVGLSGRVVATGLPQTSKMRNAEGGMRNVATEDTMPHSAEGTMPHSAFDPPHSAEGLAALMGAPLCIGARCFGALVIGNRTARAFHRSDMALLSAFANQAAVAVENARLADVERAAHARQQTLYLETIAALADAMEARDNYTHHHADQMVDRAEVLARVLGVPAEEIVIIKLAAILHDVGKIGIPDAILRKPGPLTAEEYEIMQQHPEIGARIVSRVESLKPVVPLVLHHQERWDGLGYPAGLKGEEIPRGARILAVVDAFGAMTEDRVYRDGIGEERALQELVSGAGSHFDPEAVAAFVEWWRQSRTET